MIWLKVSCEKWFSRLDLWREFSSNSYLTWSRVWSLDFAGFDENLSLSSFQLHPTLQNKRFQSNLLEINPPCNGCHRLLGYSHWSLCIGFSTGLSANSASPNEMMRRRIKIGKQTVHCTMQQLKNGVKSSRLWQIISLWILTQKFPNFSHSSLDSPKTQIKRY